jgi:hypothetical protein
VIWYHGDMIRTRDFILYLSVLIFLVLGATYTGVRDVRDIAFSMLPPFDADLEGDTLPVAAPDTTLDRSAIIARLRERIARGDGYREDAPPAVTTFVEDVASSTDETILVDAPTMEENNTGMPRSVTYCGGSAAPFSLSGAEIGSVETVGGVRVLFGYAAAASSTATTTPPRPIVGTLPVATSRAAVDSCLPDLLIGIRRDGAGWVPLTNEQARAFAQFSSDALIGYARDGFPIYGPRTDGQSLDRCGGLVVNGQYQYHIRADELFILGCYAGTPVPLKL